MMQASSGGIGKQEQKQNSPTLAKAFKPGPVLAFAINSRYLVCDVVRDKINGCVGLSDVIPRPGGGGPTIGHCSFEHD